MEEGLIAYFGYGSLVNAETLRTDYISLYPARLKGWRRHWQARPPVMSEAAVTSNLALLSIHQDASTEIDGVMVVDREAALPDLDQREAHYNRVMLDANDLDILSGEIDLKNFEADNLFVYVGKPQAQAEPPLLQSYLDAVMMGFLQVHGENGLKCFMETTIGFERNMLADRANPIYPRAVTIDDRQADMFDAILIEAGVKLVSL